LLNTTIYQSTRSHFTVHNWVYSKTKLIYSTNTQQDTFLKDHSYTFNLNGKAKTVRIYKRRLKCQPKIHRGNLTLPLIQPCILQILSDTYKS
jgi:hypothetical protein